MTVSLDDPAGRAVGVRHTTGDETSKMSNNIASSISITSTSKTMLAQTNQRDIVRKLLILGDPSIGRISDAPTLVLEEALFLLENPDVVLRGGVGLGGFSPGGRRRGGAGGASSPGNNDQDEEEGLLDANILRAVECFFKSSCSAASASSSSTSSTAVRHANAMPIRVEEAIARRMIAYLVRELSLGMADTERRLPTQAVLVALSKVPSICRDSYQL